MGYAAILFDMDGTLLETGPFWAQATRASLDEHKITLTEEEHFSLGGVLLCHLLGDKGYEQLVIDAVYETRDAALLPIMRENLRWPPGVKETLGSIALPKAIVTSAHLNVVEAIDDAIGIKAAVDVFIAGDDVVPDYKPNPKGLLMACERLNVNPASCLYVGDQKCDLEAAEAAGMAFALIRGLHTPPALMHNREIISIADVLTA